MREWTRLLPILALLLVLPGCIDTNPLLEEISDQDIEELKAYYSSDEKYMDKFPRALRIQSNFSYRDSLRLAPALPGIVAAGLSNVNVSEAKSIELARLVLRCDPSALPAEMREKLFSRLPEGPARLFIKLALSPTVELRQTTAQELSKEVEAKSGKPPDEKDREFLNYLVERTEAQEEKVGASLETLRLILFVFPRGGVKTKLILSQWEKADERLRAELLGYLALIGPEGRAALPVIRAHALAHEKDVPVALNAIIGMKLPDEETARELGALLNHADPAARKLILQSISNFRLSRSLSPADIQHVADAASYREPDPDVLRLARGMLDTLDVDYKKDPPKEELDAQADALAVVRKHMETNAITAQEFAEARRLLLADKKRMSRLQKTLRGLYEELSGGLLDAETFRSKITKATAPPDDGF